MIQYVLANHIQFTDQPININFYHAEISTKVFKVDSMIEVCFD